MSVDNHGLVAPFIDEVADPDHFWLTELLDRKANGSSRFKMLRFFESRDRAHFLEQWPTIKDLADKNGVRAYTRLTPRSREKSAKLFARKVVEQVLEGQYAGLYHQYESCVALSPVHDRKLWVFDVDSPGVDRDILRGQLEDRDVYRGRIPSRRGYHDIARPFDPRDLPLPYGVSLHKDNPTNLYIPDGAE